MKLISEKDSVFWSRAFPYVWGGFTGAIVGAMTIFSIATWTFYPLPFFVPLAMAIGGLLFWRLQFSDLVDQVWDDGDALVVRHRDRQERVAFSNILAVAFETSRPPRVTLTLRQSGSFGSELAFLAPTRLSYLWSHPLERELRSRIEAARTRVAQTE